MNKIYPESFEFTIGNFRSMIGIELIPSTISSSGEPFCCFSYMFFNVQSLTSKLFQLSYESSVAF